MNSAGFGVFNELFLGLISVGLSPVSFSSVLISVPFMNCLPTSSFTKFFSSSLSFMSFGFAQLDESISFFLFSLLLSFDPFHLFPFDPFPFDSVKSVFSLSLLSDSMISFTLIHAAIAFNFLRGGSCSASLTILSYTKLNISSRK